MHKDLCLWLDFSFQFWGTYRQALSGAEHELMDPEAASLQPFHSYS